MAFNLRRLPPSWVTALGLCVVFAVLGFSIAEPPHQLTYTQIKNKEGMPLRVVVYTPQPPRYPNAPAAVLCQPFNNPHEFVRLLALELVQEGFVVLGFDWHGRIPEENRRGAASATLDVLSLDVQAAVAHLASLPEVDPQRIAIAGHSVGGTMALEAGMTVPELIAVASIGMAGYATPERPNNVLWVLGLYDEFRKPRLMREFFQASNETAAVENETIGDFSLGTARRLAFSPTADHLTELQDRGVQREVREWFLRAAGLPESTRPLRMELRGLLLLVSWLSGLVGALLVMRRVVAARGAAVRAAPALALLGVFGVSRASGSQFPLGCDVVAGLLLFGLLAGHICTRKPETFRRGARRAVRFTLVLWASVLLTLLIHNITSYVAEPSYLLWVPEFAVRLPLDAIYSYVLAYPRPLLFSVYSPDGLSPRVWVYALLSVELILPGTLLAPVGLLRLGEQRVSSEPRRRTGSVIILLVLLAVLATIGWLRYEQGYLTAASARAALAFIGWFGLPPILLFVLLWRWSGRLMGKQPETGLR